MVTYDALMAELRNKANAELGNDITVLVRYGEPSMVAVYWDGDFIARIMLDIVNPELTAKQFIQAIREGKTASYMTAARAINELIEQQGQLKQDENHRLLAALTVDP